MKKPFAHLSVLGGFKKRTAKDVKERKVLPKFANRCAYTYYTFSDVNESIHRNF